MAANLAPSSKSSATFSKITPTANPLSDSALETLWTRLAAIYGHRWVSNYGSNPEGVGGDTWRHGLAGLTGAQLSAGLRACTLAGEDWPPSLPEFRKLCFCIPSFEAVSVMLKPGAVDVSPFARQVYGYLDTYQLRQADARTSRQLIREAYELATAYVLSGGELPAQVERIAHDSSYEERLYRDMHDRRLADLKM